VANVTIGLGQLSDDEGGWTPVLSVVPINADVAEVAAYQQPTFCLQPPTGDLAGVSHIVFDEVHYLSDAARGVVWEEAIVLAPRRYLIQP
jgi:hypothetical protein